METRTTEFEQTASNILMVRPSNFGFNFDTAGNNSFQKNDPSLSRAEIIEEARKEFDALVTLLLYSGIQVHIHQEKEGATSTDSVFPNNWFSCHKDGSFITYPMFSEKRRTERESEIIKELGEKYQIKEYLRLEKWEKEDLFLEGTGSMVLDRQHKIAYACKSNRTSETVLDEFCAVMGYSKFLFDAVDRMGFPIYHTNVMMAVCEAFVIICFDAIPCEKQKADLKKAFGQTKKEIIRISLAQMAQFAGNVIQIGNSRDDSYLLMSTSAFNSLISGQINAIEKHTKILHSDLKVIETFGGGSARCMIAEIFLPPN
ncbi:MAG: arginine deiminase-related protein [Bacteroidota bacterium]